MKQSLTMPQLQPSLAREEFGTLSEGAAVCRYVLHNGPLKLAVLSYGGIVQQLLAPDRFGEPDDLVLGFDALPQYEYASPYFGAIVGRYANRIAEGRFTLNDQLVELAVTDGPNALHGGLHGFDKKIWDVTELRDDADGATIGVRLDLVSEAGDQGYPARLRVWTTYLLRADATITITHGATNEEPPGGPSTVVNLTNHSYFNLDGEGSGSIESHELRLAASSFTPVNSNLIPTGELRPVQGTALDFRTAHRIGQELRSSEDQMLWAQGYDHNFVLDRPHLQTHGSAVATVTSARSGRRLEVWTDQPAVQLYTANALDGSLIGKSGRSYRQADALCLETQHFPDSPNQPSFPSTVLQPQQTFETSTVWRFSTW